MAVVKNSVDVAEILSRLDVILLMTVSWAPRVSLMMVFWTLSRLLMPMIFLRHVISIENGFTGRERGKLLLTVQNTISC